VTSVVCTRDMSGDTVAQHAILARVEYLLEVWAGSMRVLVNRVFRA
jgi:hypothetical protein